MNKTLKIVGIGCLGMFGITTILIILVGVFSPDLSTSTENVSKNRAIDSTQLKKELRIKDSLDLVSKEKREKAENSLKKFRKKEDEFQGVFFYTESRAPRYVNVNFIYPYIAKNNEDYSLRLKFQYTAEDWLFIEKGIFLIDGEKYIVTGNWERDHDSKIWEWLDIPVGETEYTLLHKIANSKIAKIRYEGSQYRKDRNITSKEKSIIKKTLEVYDDLK